jgi:GNAT superfamily N-acetyltransferase
VNARGVAIRPAIPDDVPLVLELIRGLAEYERLTHELSATEPALREHLFGPRPYCEALIAEDGDGPAGFALFFHTYSTFLALPGLHLEDIFVYPERRGRGIGKALFVRLAQIAVERGCGRVEWTVLNWNEPSIGFYKSLGARLLDDWTSCRLDGDALRSLAGA